MPGEIRTSRRGPLGPPKPWSSASVPPKGVFCKEGDYWTVGLGRTTVRLKDAKGFSYLSYLLRHPATEFHVLDLVAGVASGSSGEVGRSAFGLERRNGELEKAGIHLGGLGDAGEVLDDRAKSAYRRRLAELHEELGDAKALGKVESAERLEQEIDALTGELSRAVGLGGRSRRAASASERARQTVTKTIRAVIERVAQNNAGLGDIFSRTIKTGTFCSYEPDPDLLIAWEFTATLPESPITRPAASVSGDEEQHSLAILSPVPFSAAQRTPFVGREREFSAIRSSIGRAQAGNGSVIMLAGGLGVGKTRLALEMAESATRDGFPCVVGRCYERDEPFPYLPFAEIIEGNLAQSASLNDYRQGIGDNAAELAQIAPSLRRVFPDIPQPVELPPAQQRPYLFQSFSEALARVARIRPQLLVLEDLHWADESTLALLTYLANRIAQLGTVIIGTYRSGYSDDNPVLVRTLEELIRLGVRPLKLGGLSKDAVAQMLRGLSQRDISENLVSAIFEESQGYPFFVEEVYRHLVEEEKVFDTDGQFRTDIKIDEIDVPENVRLIISRRLDRLDENKRRALAAAAVIGRSFSFRLLTEVSQIDVDELFTVIEKAQEMGIIVPSAEGPERPFTFSHELVRQTLLAGISAPRQERLHAAVADAIERLYPGAVNERAGEIADHLHKAGSFANDQKLVRWLTLAGKSALEAAAFEEARRKFQSVLSHHVALDPRQRADLLVSLAYAERGLELWDAVIAHLAEALEISTTVGDREMTGRSFTDLTEAFGLTGRFRESYESALRGLSTLPPEASVHRARLLAALGEACSAAGEYETANEALREALTIASQFQDSKLAAGLVGRRSIVNSRFFRWKEAAADGFRSIQSGTEEGSWQHATQLRILHQSLIYLGRLHEAANIATALEPLAKRIGQSYSIAALFSSRACAEFGRFPDLSILETNLREALKPGQTARFPNLQTLFQVQLSIAEFFRGNLASALSHAKAACRSDTGFIRGFGIGTLFRHMAYAGDRDGALAILDEERTLVPRSGQPNSQGSWFMLALVIEGLFILGEHSQAGELYPLARELLDTGAVKLWPIFRLTHTVAGMAATAARHWEAAEVHFQTAMQQADSFPDLLEQAEICRFHAMMLINRAGPGDRDKARSLLNKALETYTQIGMPRHIEMTHRL